MKHTEKYLQAKWVTENPKGYDERDVARANSYCEAYLEGYNQALSIADVVGRSELLTCECVGLGSTECNKINDKWICCRCNRPLVG